MSTNKSEGLVSVLFNGKMKNAKFKMQNGNKVTKKQGHHYVIFSRPSKIRNYDLSKYDS